MEQKILVYGLTNNRGGMEAYFINYYQEIKKQGFPIEIDFVTDYSEIAYHDIIEKFGDKVYFIPSRRENIVKHFFFLRKLIRENSYTKVYFNVLSASTVFTIAAAYKIKNCKVIVHSHNDSVKAIKRHYIFRPFLNLMADVKLACSSKAAVFMFGKKNTEKNKVIIINNAINTDTYTYSEKKRAKKRKELNIINNYVIGTVGRLCYQKNTLFLLDIFQQVLEYIPEAMLLIVGEGELRGEVEKKIKKKNLEKQVLLLGMRKDVPDLLQSMDIFLLPSRFEGLSIAALEAQCIGLPVLASKNVSIETKIVSQFERLPLDEEKQWINRICYFYRNFDRKSCNEDLVNHGFDIKNQCGKLMSVLNHN